MSGVPSETLTTPALLSQRERREKNETVGCAVRTANPLVVRYRFPSLPLGERG